MAEDCLPLVDHRAEAASWRPPGAPTLETRALPDADVPRTRPRAWGAAAAAASLAVAVVTLCLTASGSHRTRGSHRGPVARQMLGEMGQNLFVDVWITNGRFGNNLHEMLYGVLFARAAGAKSARFHTYGDSVQASDIFDLVQDHGECSVNFSSLPCDWTQSWNCPGQRNGSLGQAFDDGSLGYKCCCQLEEWKLEVPLDHDPRDRTFGQGSCHDRARVPRECRKVADGYCQESGQYVGNFWNMHCEGMAASEYHDVGLRYLRPRFRRELASCLADRSRADDEDLLTVHLRGDDLWPEDLGAYDDVAGSWARAQPPCSMYERILQQGSFRRVLVVTSQDRRSPCLRWFEDFGRRGSVAVVVQTLSLLEDSCALLSARHLALSYSTFPLALSLLSTRVRRIYALERLIGNAALNCQLWQGVELLRYQVAPSAETVTYQALGRWMLRYPVENVSGPLLCA